MKFDYALRKTDFKGIHTSNTLQLTNFQRAQFGKMDVGDLYPEYFILNVKHFDNVAKDTLNLLGL